MAGRNYGTDPYGIISRGDPSARGGSSVSVGRVGNSVRDYSSPGRSFGSGVGATLSLPMKTKSKAKGGEIKKSGCSVKAYGDMIKKAAGGKVQTSADTARKLATEMGGMKKGGKVQKKALGGAMGMSAPSARQQNGFMGGKFTYTDIPGTAGGLKLNPTSQPVAVKPPTARRVAADELRAIQQARRAKKGASAIDAIRGSLGAMSITPAPNATPGMKKGGKPKDGLAVMIAIGKPMKGMKKPVKKAVGGAGKTRKGMCDAPEKLARGGAGKVRKGMMSPSGDMLQPVKPKAGLKSSY